MALDTITRVLEIDCCWLQTITDRKHKKLLLLAERGFSREMHHEIATMDLGHSFSKQIIGLGDKIIIPDLSNDGLYGLPSFQATGYKWLVAVPLMTYRVHGILGTASRNRKLLQKDTDELIMVIAGLIAASLNKAQLTREPAAVKKSTRAIAPEVHAEPEAAEIKAEIIAETPADAVPPENPPPQKKVAPPEGAFHTHKRRMENFRKSHS